MARYTVRSRLHCALRLSQLRVLGHWVLGSLDCGCLNPWVQWLLGSLRRLVIRFMDSFLLRRDEQIHTQNAEAREPSRGSPVTFLTGFRKSADDTLYVHVRSMIPAGSVLHLRDFIKPF